MWEYCKSIPFNVQPLHTLSVLRIHCSVSLTIEIQVKPQWKRPASAARACPESSPCFSFATSPRYRQDWGTRWLPGRRRGWGVLFIQPRPKLGLHNLSKNNREGKTVRGRKSCSLCSHAHWPVCRVEKCSRPPVWESVSVCVCLCVYFQRRQLQWDSVHCILVYVRPQAEEDPSTQHEDGGSPAEPVAPVELVICLQNRSINEFDWVEDQSAGLKNH